MENHYDELTEAQKKAAIEMFTNEICEVISSMDYAEVEPGEIDAERKFRAELIESIKDSCCDMVCNYDETQVESLYQWYILKHYN